MVTGLIRVIKLYVMLCYVYNLSELQLSFNPFCLLTDPISFTLTPFSLGRNIQSFNADFSISHEICKTRSQDKGNTKGYNF